MERSESGGDAPPDPLRVLVAALDAEPDHYRRVWRLIFAFEWAVKWATAVVVGDLLDRAEVDERLRRTFVSNFGQPSLGAWVRILRETIEAQGDDRPWRAWDRVAELDGRHRIVNLRNTYAHGAFEDDATNERNVATYRPVLDELISSPMFREVALLVRDGEQVRQLGGPRVPPEMTPPEPGAYAWVRGDRSMIDLWPVAAYLDDVSTDGAALYLFNGVRGRAVEGQNYEIPNRVRRTELHGRLLDRLPLDTWRAALGTDRDPYRPRVDALAEGLVGRQRERDELVGRLLASDGETVLWGPPGQGKSALMAAVDRQLRDEHGDEVVVLDAFLRRGDATSRPAAVLRSWVRRLSSLLGTSEEAPAGEEALSERLAELLSWWAASGPLPLVLLVDAVDEQLEFLPHLPRTATGLRLLWSSRPVEAALVAAGQRGVGPSRSHDLSPLGTGSVRAILLRGVDALDRRLGTEYVATVHQRSAGNPLFVQVLADELFHDVGRVGRTDRVPDQLDSLFRDAFDRITDTARDESRVDLLHLLSTVREPVDAGQAGALLRIRSSRMRAELRACHELLTWDPRDRVTLYHDELRSWLVAAHPDEVSDVEVRLAEAAVAHRAPDAATPYLVRHGVGHILTVADRRPDLVAAAIRHLSDPEELRRRSQILAPFELVNDLAGLHASAVDDHPAVDGLVEALVEVLARGEMGPAAASQDTVTAAVMYRDDPRFTDSLLERAAAPGSGLSEQDQLAYRGLLGDRLRRRGSADDLARARHLLNGVIAEADDSHGGRSVRSRATYSLAYVDHLGGHVRDAIVGMDRAVVAARAAGDDVGSWIAACVGAQVGYLSGEVSAAAYRATLLAARRAFEEVAPTDRGAARWVSNVAAHLFEVAFEEGQADLAGQHLAELDDQPWVAGIGPVALDSPRAARLALLRGDPRPVLEVLSRRIGAWLDADGRPGPRENLARDYRDLAWALDVAGRTPEAITTLERGLTCPPVGASWAWRPHLQEHLRRLTAG